MRPTKKKIEIKHGNALIRSELFVVGYTDLNRKSRLGAGMHQRIYQG